MNMSDLSRVIEQVGKDRGIKKEVIIEALEQAVLLAAQKKFGVGAQLEAHYNPESGEIELFQFKQVVPTEDDIGDPDMDIDLVEARKLDPEVNSGDELGIKLDAPDFGRIDAQTAKQVIFQKVRDAERDIIYGEFIHRKGEVISGIARRVERGSLIIDLGKTDAMLPRSEIIPGETFKPGDRVQAYLSDVVMTPRGPQLYMTRTSPKFLAKLFEMEVPEVADAIVEIKAAAREPGSRAKVAVWSKDRDVDPVGACVGMKGVRVQNVIHELRGEKIDIIPWNENSALFVKAALQPAEISSIKMDERNKSMEIMVEDDQLSLAIGKRGQNVRLAAMLTGWRLDIISKTKLQKRMADAVFNLQHIEGVNETLAQGLYQTGFLNVFQVAEAQIESLMKVPGFGTEEEAKNLKLRAQTVVEKGGEAIMLTKDGTPLESTQQVKTGPSIQSPAGPVRDSKSLAEERLRQEMAAAGMGSKPKPSGDDKDSDRKSE
ncbi:MAG: transcription termination factor NusA [Bdellovibrionota bacterium]